MKILLISKDSNLADVCNTWNQILCEEITIYNKSNEPLNIFSHTLKVNPSVLIIDDDFTAPNTEELIRSIREIKKELAIVFVTSDDGLELGRKITGLGIQFYAIKPLDSDILRESLQSLLRSRKDNYNRSIF